MTHKTPLAPQGTGTKAAPGEAVPLVRGTASPEELSAVIAVVAVLASAGDEPEETDTASTGGATGTRSAWNSPAQMVRTTHPHGRGGWRASASPR
jgi:hypothetical protein